LDENQEFPGYEEVAVFMDGGYEWSEMRVYRKDFRLFCLMDSGCSCTGWNDGRLSESDMIELPTLEAARNAWDKYRTEYYHCEQPWLEVVEKFRALGLR
jgi:hypothetical protein